MKNLSNFFYFIICLISTTSISAQELFHVKGKLFDSETGNPIAFVNISLSGVSKGTISDESGNFEFSFHTKPYTKLIFSHINYRKKEVDVSTIFDKNNFSIYLDSKCELIDNVVVTASLYQQPKSKLAKPVAIIHSKEIKDNFNSNIIDVLATKPSFTQVWEYHSPIIFRGLNSKRVIMLKNGNRRIGTFPGGYFGQDMNIYDSKKIEIIKGPGSVIYGSGAISGIINVIGHEPFGKKATKTNILSGFGSNNNEFLEMANICHKSENFGLQISGKYRKTNNYVYGDGKTARNSNVEDRDISVNTGFKLSPKQSIKLNMEYHYGDWGKPRGFNGDLKEYTKIRNTEENFHADIKYEYKINGLIEKIATSFYLDNGTRDYYKYKLSEISAKVTSLELVHYNSLYGGGQAHALLKFTEKSNFILGVDAYSFRLDNPAELIDYYNETKGEEKGISGSGQQNIGVFVRNETQMTKNIKLVSGLRSDYVEVLEGKRILKSGKIESRKAFSGNLGTVISLNPNNHLSFNVGRAFRMPTAEELFTEIISCKGVKQGNPDLKPEYSWNFDLGFRGNSSDKLIDYDLALFYNVLDDFICETQVLDNEDVDFSFENTNAQIWGGEISTSYRLNDLFKNGNSLITSIGASYVYGIDKSGDKDESLFGIPPFKTIVSFDYRGLFNKYWITGYTLKLRSQYVAAQNRIPSIPEGTNPGPWGYQKSEPNATFNLVFGINSNSIPGHPKFRFLVKNIFNTNYRPYGSYIPAMGRNFKLMLLFTIK